VTSSGGGITIHRSQHAQQYVVVPNGIARNTRLTFRARGLLVMLLSLPPEWHVTADMLAEDNPDSRTAIRAAMLELREAGYVLVHRIQGERGRWTTRLEVFDTASTERALAASGPTSGDATNPQVAPNAGGPAAGQTAFIPKYRGSARTRSRPRAEPEPRPEWCGRCDRVTRHVDVGDGAVARCPDCHPIAVAARRPAP
jgi:hypothetical protein